MKKFGISLIVIGAATAVIGSLGGSPIMNPVIIYTGIKAFSRLLIASIPIAGAGLALTAVGYMPNLRAHLAKQAALKQLEAARRAESRPTLSYAAATYDPADIRRRLEGIGHKRPDLKDLLAKCIGQLNALDRRQTRLKELLDLNAAEYLRGTEDLLKEVEQFLCKNFRRIINRGIVSELDDDSVFAADDQYATYAELIEAVIAGNQRELDNINKFLADLAELISENQDNAETTLEAWMAVIRDSLKKEEA